MGISSSESRTSVVGLALTSLVEFSQGEMREWSSKRSKALCVILRRGVITRGWLIFMVMPPYFHYANLSSFNLGIPTQYVRMLDIQSIGRLASLPSTSFRESCFLFLFLSRSTTSTRLSIWPWGVNTTSPEIFFELLYNKPWVLLLSKSGWLRFSLILLKFSSGPPTSACFKGCDLNTEVSRVEISWFSTWWPHRQP